MVDKGKGIEESACSSDTMVVFPREIFAMLPPCTTSFNAVVNFIDNLYHPLIKDFDDVDECSSQHIEDISDLNQTNDAGGSKDREADKPYISSPTDPFLFAMSNAGEESSRGSRRSLDLEEMDDDNEYSVEHDEDISGPDPDEGGPSEGNSRGKGKGKDAEERRSARISYSSNSSSTSSDSGVTSDALGIVDRPSGTLRNHGPRTWQSPRSQSTITVTEMDPEEEASEDDASFGAPLSRSSSHKHPPSSSFVSSSPMIHAENSGFPRRSPRRGNTYNPTALRGPQPVRVFSLEHGWTVPPRSPSRFEDSSENEPPPYDEDMFEDSDELPPPNQFSMRSPRRSFRELDILEGIEPQVRSFRMSQDQESSTSVTELETVEEEDENKDTEVAAAKSNTPSGPSSHSEGSSLTELGAPSEPDAPPSYTASVHPSMSLASVPAIKDTPPPEQPSTISPMNLGEQEHTLETAEPLSENPLDASHLSDVQAGIVLLPDNLTHQAFIRDPVLRRFCVGYHDETQTSFSSMERSIFHFRDFVASQNSMSERDILARDDKYDDDSSEQASEDMEAVKETPYAHPGSTTLQIAEPVVQNTPASAAQSGTNPGPMSPGDLNSTKPSTRKRQEQGTELLPGLSIKQARTYEEKREGEVSPMDTYGEGEVRPNHTESEEFNGRRHQRTPEHDTEMDDPEASYPDDIPTFFFADISEINKHYSAQPTQSNEGWSAPGDWCCRFCGRLNAKIKTECYGCLSKEAHMVPKVGHISETQQSQNKKVLSARSAQELHTQTVLNSEALEDLGPQPEKSHLAVSSPESPQSDEPQATKERKRKRKY